MKNSRTAISLLALAAMTAQASAADLCNPSSAAALKTAAVQQELMVAGFTCGAGDAYNRFVAAHQSELQRSDADLKAYFRSRDHGKEAGYDSYKTKAANLSALTSATLGARYCEGTAHAFAAAGRSATLQDFISAERLLITAPDACAGPSAVRSGVAASTHIVGLAGAAKVVGVVTAWTASSNASAMPMDAQSSRSRNKRQPIATTRFPYIQAPVELQAGVVKKRLVPGESSGCDIAVEPHFSINALHAWILGRIWTDAVKLCSSRTERGRGVMSGAMA